MTKKIEIGNIFQLDTSKGKAYIQYVYEHESLGEYVKVFYNLYDVEPKDFSRITKEEDFFYINFALRAAMKLNIIKKVGNIAISKDFILPSFFREEHLFKENWWQIVDTKTWHRESVKTLSEEQKKLSPWGMWNDTLLIENLEKGWRLENWI
ncbi:hypothetical protein [uncultured Aquimarina sp.]|uniref:hypothetical protein n=1 Tax=uncultured Aquimarina sp. TaxID=575652 RepID=UPI0026351923|nr:hypothetical protein [uncultured Aquimarina sp.]